MNGDGVEVEAGNAGGITICAMAEPESESQSKSKAKSKAAGESPASTQPAVKLTPKQLGEIAEAEFIAKAVGLGFVVAKPWGDSEPYDFIVNPKKSFIFLAGAGEVGAHDWGGWRVQLSGSRPFAAVL